MPWLIRGGKVQAENGDGMMEILKSVNELSVYLFYICYIILFYLSLKRCFLRDGYSKVKLFFLSLITNPFCVFLLLTVLTTTVVFFREVLNSDLGIHSIATTDYGYLATDRFYSSLIVLITTILFIVVIMPVSYLMGKTLKAYNRSMVMFVYIMFSVVIILVDIRSSKIQKDAEWIIQIADNLSNIAIIMVMCLLYLFVIKALSRLTDRKRHVNWKMFLIAPTAFILGYGILDYYTYTFCSNDAKHAVRILSYVILVLFIWAFYIIINNIKATDDAIMAKDEIKILSVEVMEALAHTIDAKDEYTRGHSVRVAKYSRMLSERLGLSSDECENVYYMALLHDIGKIGVPNEIINSTSKLTDDEYAVIKTHPGIGYDILAEIKSRPDLSIGARWHHERYDGKGYPDGKKGEEIPFFARIIAVADTYDAMTSNRSYRKYLPQDKVRSEIEKNAGTQFDPDVAKCMLEIIDQDIDYILHE